MTAPNREMYDLFDRELQRAQELNFNDLRLFVQSNITNPFQIMLVDYISWMHMVVQIKRSLYH